MRIDVDQERCEGHGQCAEKAPGVYALDDDGYVQLLASEDLEAALAGARSCPVAALKVVEQ